MPEVAFPVSECIYFWTAAYFRKGNTIVVRIKLEPQYPISDDALAELKARWRDGIRAKWHDKYPCPPNSDNLQFDVEFVETGWHHTVKIRRGPHRSNMLEWDDADDGHAASHEYGHMLGLPDEYSDAKRCPSRSPVGTGTVMEDNSAPVNERLIHTICEGSVTEPPEQIANPSTDGIDFSQPMKFVLRVTGGRSDERLDAIVQLDEESRTAVVSSADALRNIAPRSSAASGSGELIKVLRTRAQELLLQTDSTKRPQIVPHSLVAQLDITAGGKHFQYVFPVDESQIPLERDAASPSHPFTQIVPLTTSEPLKEIYKAMTTAADQAECPCENDAPQESTATEQDLTHLSPEQLTLYREIQADEAHAPPEPVTTVAAPPERQTHRVPLGTHKLPNEIRGCWRHGVDTRSVRIKVWVDISHPTLFDFLNKASDCALGCAGGAIILAVATGAGSAVAIPAFKACFYACLATQVGHSVAREVNIDFGSDKTTTRWSGH